MKKVLVTGGTGFIGSHLCERLLKKGFFILDFPEEAESKCIVQSRCSLLKQKSSWQSNSVN